ncbi:MAG: lipopolysaccharide assembly protein LapB [Gammaproteobacteria bacterium]|nr:lipopolysaccharide assembly protein LapB [Gammaproteobacteria bacterium]
MDIWASLVIILVALLIGWIYGRFSAPSRRKNPDKNEPVDCTESYIQGLNYLLANKSDKAIELFIDLIKVDKETMETHLALGNLFRSKGEVDRAIKIHQNLIARPNLDQNQRSMALTELAEDYLKAGLLDRAENLFKELVQINPKNRYAQRKLFELFSVEKSWFDAMQAALVLYQLGDADSRLILTQCYCEIADKFLKEGNLRDAREYLNKALQIDDQCVRALLLLIELHLKNNDTGKASKLLTQLLKNSPQYLELYLQPAREIYLIQGSAGHYQSFLMDQYNKQPNSSVALKLLESYQAGEQHEALIEFMQQSLQQSPSLEIFDFALGYLRSRPQQLDHLWQDITGQFRQIKNKRLTYVCNICGYGSHEMHWLCPSCNTWASIKPA